MQSVTEPQLGLFSVLQIKGWGVLGREFEGVGVLSLRLNIDITLSGSHERSPASRNSYLDVAFTHCNIKHSVKSYKEVVLCNVEKLSTHHIFNFPILCLYERVKITKIKWLEYMRGISKHTKSINVMFITVFLQLIRVMALAA